VNLFVTCWDNINRTGTSRTTNKIRTINTTIRTTYQTLVTETTGLMFTRVGGTDNRVITTTTGGVPEIPESKGRMSTSSMIQYGNNEKEVIHSMFTFS
jgi:hypothetical protein